MLKPMNKTNVLNILKLFIHFRLVENNDNYLHVNV